MALPLEASLAMAQPSNAQGERVIAPDWRTIDTPWEPQPIAWRDRNRERRQSALRAYAQSGFNYLVREVLVHADDYPYSSRPMTEERANTATTRTDEELALLKNSCDVHTPKVTWHVFTDEQGTVRTLARVQVIDGEAPNYSYEYGQLMLKQDLQKGHTWKRGFEEYRWLAAPGLRLRDTEGAITQSVFGAPRELQAPRQDWNLHFVDIEPIFWLLVDVQR